MGNFRYEDHLQRHQELLREGEQERLVYIATANRQFPRLPHILTWLRITLRLRAAQRKLAQPTLARSPRPLAE